MKATCRVFAFIIFFTKNAPQFKQKRQPQKTSENDAPGDSKASQNALKCDAFPSKKRQIAAKNRFLEGLFF